MYTLTCAGDVGDDEFRARLRSWLAWGRRYAGPWFRYYVWVADLQQRGVLHAHVLLFKRMPRRLWLRLRGLWTDHYGMGPGSFDVQTVRRASRAATYLARYVTRQHGGVHRVTIDGEGMLGFEPLRVSRHNGRAYVREAFHGNAYGIASTLRVLGRPLTELRLPWGAGAALEAVNLRGMVAFFDGPGEAHAWLSRALGPGG